MLLRQEIESLKLVRQENGQPPPADQFDVTSYNLRLGAQYWVVGDGGEPTEIRDCSRGIGVLKLPPFACALVGTDEIIQLPADVAGRWGLKIRPAMSGLVFQAGPQIEPGSHGRMFGLLFNLSSRERLLHYQTPLWSIDFVRLPTPVQGLKLTNAPVLDMRSYSQLGPPTGSLNEIYADYRRIQASVSARRDLIVGITLALITLTASIAIPLTVATLYNQDTERHQIVDKRIDLIESQLNRAPSTSPTIGSTSLPTPRPTPTP